MSFIGDVTKGLSDVAGMATPLGAIAGGISAVKGLFGNSSGDAMALAEKQHQWDVEENQRNRDFQRAEWQRQFDAINAYNDPSATAERLQKAGLNATAILNGQGSAIGQSSGSPSAPSGAHGLNPMPDVVSQVGFQSQESIFKRLEMLGNLSRSAALLPETKAKLSAEVDNVLNDSRFKSIKADSEDFMLSLDKYFKPFERYAGVRQALANLALADAETKLAIAEGKQVEENALKIAEEKLLTIAKRHLSEKELDALKIDLKYRDMQNQMQIRESKSRQAANYAGAEQSITQADVNREIRRLQSALADIEENGKEYKLDSLITKYQNDKVLSDADAEEARLRISRVMQIENKRSTQFFKEIDGLTEWLKSKISIFK